MVHYLKVLIMSDELSLKVSHIYLKACPNEVRSTNQWVFHRLKVSAKTSRNDLTISGLQLRGRILHDVVFRALAEC